MAEENKNKNEEEKKSAFKSDDLMIKPKSDKAEKAEEAAEPEQADTNSFKKSKDETEKKPAKKYTEGERLFNFRLKELKKGKKSKKKKQPVRKYELKQPKLFILKKPEKASYAGLIARTFIVFMLSLIIFAGNVYLESDFFDTGKALPKQEGILVVPEGASVSVTDEGQTLAVSESYNLDGGEDVSTGTAENVIIDFPGYGIMRLDMQTNVMVNEFDIDKNAYSFDIYSGRLWLNSLYDDYNITLKSGFLTLKPGNSSIDIQYDGAKTTVYSHKHDVYVGINNSEGDLINRFWIAEGNEADFDDSFIRRQTETIEKLLYAKLVKEFNYSRPSRDSLNEDTWITENSRKDEDLRDEVKDEYYSMLRNEGLKVLSTSSLRFQMKSLLADLRSSLIFTETRKIDQMLDSVFENLHDAQYLYSQANNSDASVRLSLFSQDLNQSKYVNDDYFTEESLRRLESKLADLYFVNPGETLYPVKSELFDLIMQNRYKRNMAAKEKFDHLTVKLNDVYDSINIETSEALKVFESYFDSYNSIRNTYKNDLTSIFDQIVKQNILVDNILYSSPDLYKVEYFNVKRSMENDYILALQNERDKREQRQTLISRKINLLKRIRYFLFNESITPDDARQIVFVVIQDIENLKKETLDVAAVNQLFEKRLDDFGVFWQYLNSPEYSTTPLHGASHSERYEEFKKVQEEIVTFSDVQEEILGEAEEEERTVESVLNQAEEDLENANITNVEFGFYNDTASTKIPILNANARGINFRATYDWDRKLLSNIVVDDDLLTAEGVKLDNAGSFITQAISARDTVTRATPQIPERETEEPLADVKKAAKVFIKQKFAEMGIVLETENIEIIDLGLGDYEIQNVYFSELRDAVFSFEYNTREDKASNLIINTEAGDKVVDDSFSPTFLKAVVKKVYEEA